MNRYAKGEARAWALESLRGCCGCVQPTFTSALDELNEEAIRHDVRREKEIGMSGVLIVSEWDDACGVRRVHPDRRR